MVRTTRLIIIPLILLVLILPSLMVPARASGINVTVSRDSVTITMSYTMYQNITTSLPLFNVAADQSSPIAQQIQSGFQSAVPKAHIDQLTLHARTAEVNNVTGLWMLQENYTMTVSGVTTNTGGRIVADMSFLTSKNNQSIILSGYELNNIGQAYILQGFQRFPPDSKTKYYALTAGFNLPLVPEQFTQGYSILDFSWIKPLDWSGRYTPFATSTVWSFQPTTPPFNVTIGTGLTTEQTFLKEYKAYITSSLQITAPPSSQLNFTTITFDIPTAAEVVMPIIILASLIVAIGGFVVERMISRSTRQAKGRKR